MRNVHVSKRRRTLGRLSALSAGLFDLLTYLLYDDGSAEVHALDVFSIYTGGMKVRPNDGELTAREAVLTFSTRMLFVMEEESSGKAGPVFYPEFFLFLNIPMFGPSRDYYGLVSCCRSLWERGLLTTFTRPEMEGGEAAVIHAMYTRVGWAG